MFNFLRKHNEPSITANNRIATFEKVSYKEFEKAFRNIDPIVYESVAYNYFNKDDLPSLREYYDNIILPSRSTNGSAGYDFYSPIPFAFCPNSASVLPTGIRCRIENGWFLAMYPRSGLGFKHGLSLANTTGIIDSDYYYADNEGHIMIKAFTRNHELEIEAGDRFCQGIFLPYGITTNDNAGGKRSGGFGSTGK